MKTTLFHPLLTHSSPNNRACYEEAPSQFWAGFDQTHPPFGASQKDKTIFLDDPQWQLVSHLFPPFWDSSR